MMTITDTETISAIATPAGRSGIGIVRISGPECLNIAIRVLGFSPEPRRAYFSNFLSTEGEALDKGIALYFKAPNSFTGEDVLELQGHGGSFILNRILQCTLDMGCRLANPGEFSERSFINGKMDLTQLEAVADLINANSEQAARSAIRTLEGEFSRRVNQLVNSITTLRVYLEAAIDFTDEDIDFISEGNVAEKLKEIMEQTADVFEQARLGSILQEGIKVAIAGRPNAGKSSLLNALSGRESAIVTDIPGTTRDVLKETIDLDGITVHVIDTAGLRDSTDPVEQEGIKRARQAIEDADVVLLIVDAHWYATMQADIHSQHSTDTADNSEAVVSSTVPDDFALEDSVLDSLFLETGLPKSIPASHRLLVILNKTDLLDDDSSLTAQENVTINGHSVPCIPVSAKALTGFNLLRDTLKQTVGFTAGEEGNFIARERHMRALQRAMESQESAASQLRNGENIELVAEDLRQAQNHLGEITGQVTSDKLLGEIFSSFCIGK